MMIAAYLLAVLAGVDAKMWETLNGEDGFYELSNYCFGLTPDSEGKSTLTGEWEINFRSNAEDADLAQDLTMYVFDDEWNYGAEFVRDANLVCEPGELEKAAAEAKNTDRLENSYGLQWGRRQPDGYVYATLRDGIHETMKARTWSLILAGDCTPFGEFEYRTLVDSDGYYHEGQGPANCYPPGPEARTHIHNMTVVLIALATIVMVLGAILFTMCWKAKHANRKSFAPQSAMDSEVAY